MASNTCVMNDGYVVAATEILAVEVGTSTDLPTCYVSPTALFCARYESLEVEGDFYELICFMK